MTKFPEAYLPGYSKFGRIALTTSFVLFLVTTLHISVPEVSQCQENANLLSKESINTLHTDHQF